MLQIPDNFLIQKELCERKLSYFVEKVWHVLEPNKQFISNWHVDCICEHLELVSSGGILNLIINIPPGCMKSLIVSVCFPAWLWIKRPEERLLVASYSKTLSLRDSVKTRRLILSPYYQKNWSLNYKLTDDQNTKEKFENNKLGYRIATSVFGTVTGERGNLILDDPHNALEIHSPTMREKTLMWLSEVWSSRRDNPITSFNIIIMQRLHERDVTGFILSEWGNFEHLCLPMEYQPQFIQEYKTKLWPYDVRTQENELLEPVRFPKEQVDTLKKQLGIFASSGQLNQRPSPTTGSIFELSQFCFWYENLKEISEIEISIKTLGTQICKVVELPKEFDLIFQSWDFSFKDTKASDYVVGQVWGQLDNKLFLLYQTRKRLDFNNSCEEIKKITKLFPNTVLILIEEKANGAAIISSLRKQLPRIKAINPTSSKISRAYAATPYFEQSKIFIPTPNKFDWVEQYIINMCGFPSVAYDDEIDATTQAINYTFLYKPIITISK